MPVSTFLLTINPNQTSDKVSREELGDVMDVIFENIPTFILYLDERKASSRYIDSIEVLAKSIEVGGKFGRTHSHSLIQIKHSTRIQLRHRKIAEYVGGMLELDTALNSDSQYVPESDIDTTLKYVFKELPEFKIKNKKHKRRRDVESEMGEQPLGRRRVRKRGVRRI